MNISLEQFEKLVSEALDSLPDKFLHRLNNIAIFVKDSPTKEQLSKLERKNNYILFGLFEGYAQAKRLNFGPVLPDRITLFRKSILKNCSNLQECKTQIVKTVKHEIAHHFGLDEKGARRAGRN
ncbi:MAG: metallopeptidase family protein [Patescibacteria group bacterium]